MQGAAFHADGRQKGCAIRDNGGWVVGDGQVHRPWRRGAGHCDRGCIDIALFRPPPLRGAVPRLADSMSKIYRAIRTVVYNAEIRPEFEI